MTLNFDSLPLPQCFWCWRGNPGLCPCQASILATSYIPSPLSWFKSEFFHLLHIYTHQMLELIRLLTTCISLEWSPSGVLCEWGLRCWVESPRTLLYCIPDLASTLVPAPRRTSGLRAAPLAERPRSLLCPARFPAGRAWGLAVT